MDGIMGMTLAMAVSTGALRLVQHLRRRKNRAWRYIATLPVDTGTLARAALLRAADDTGRCLLFAVFLCLLPWILPPDPLIFDPHGVPIALSVLHLSLNGATLAGLLLVIVLLWCICAIALMPRWLLVSAVGVLLLYAALGVYFDGLLWRISSVLNEDKILFLLGVISFLVYGRQHYRAFRLGLIKPGDMRFSVAVWLLLITGLSIILYNYNIWTQSANVVSGIDLMLFPLLPGACVLDFYRWRHGR